MACDPAQARPHRPRWFGLDAAPYSGAGDAQLARLAAWVVGTPDIDATLQAASRAGLDLGRATAMRRGALEWRISIRDDGCLPECGVVPVVIEWPGGTEAAGTMAETGLRLVEIRLQHPEPVAIDRWLRAIDARQLVTLPDIPATRALLQARFSTRHEDALILSSA